MRFGPRECATFEGLPEVECGSPNGSSEGPLTAHQSYALSNTAFLDSFRGYAPISGGRQTDCGGERDGLTLTDRDLPLWASMPSTSEMPSFSDMTKRYDRLLDEWAGEAPGDYA